MNSDIEQSMNTIVNPIQSYHCTLIYIKLVSGEQRNKQI